MCKDSICLRRKAGGGTSLALVRKIKLCRRSDISLEIMTSKGENSCNDIDLPFHAGVQSGLPPHRRRPLHVEPLKVPASVKKHFANGCKTRSSRSTDWQRAGAIIYRGPDGVILCF